MNDGILTLKNPEILHRGGLKQALEILFERHVCRHIAHLLRGIDDTGVVAELQGADHSCSNTHQQRERYLLQDNREKRKSCQ